MKKIGKTVLIAFVVLVLLSALSSTCSKSKSGSESVSEGASSTATQTSSSQASSSVEIPKSNEEELVGTWDVIYLRADENEYDEDDLQKARENGTDYYMVLNEDQTAIFVKGDTRDDYTWKETGKGTGAIGQATMAVSNGILTVKDKNGTPFMKLAKGEERSSLPAKSDETSNTSTEQANDGEVSSDLKEMLDSYEAFMDEYIEFMESYQESSDTMSMLSQYTEYMQKYTDFMQKVESVDTDDMSAADYAYYIEVTSRVSQKLLKVSGF